MTGSPLDSLLRNHGISTLILSGVSVSFAILNLTMDAVRMTNTLSMLATTATTADILAAWPDI